MQSRMYADSARHAVTALGLGDVSLIGSTWLLDPHNHSGNIALGLGVKAPTGTHTATDAYFLKGGTSIQYPVDQSIEPGRSEEHTSELQSPCNLVCRLLLEKKKKKQQ